MNSSPKVMPHTHARSLHRKWYVRKHGTLGQGAVPMHEESVPAYVKWTSWIKENNAIILHLGSREEGLTSRRAANGHLRNPSSPSLL